MGAKSPLISNSLGSHKASLEVGNHQTSQDCQANEMQYNASFNCRNSSSMQYCEANPEQKCETQSADDDHPPHIIAYGFDEESSIFTDTNVPYQCDCGSKPLSGPVAPSTGTTIVPALSQESLGSAPSSLEDISSSRLLACESVPDAATSPLSVPDQEIAMAREYLTRYERGDGWVSAATNGVLRANQLPRRFQVENKLLNRIMEDKFCIALTDLCQATGDTRFYYAPPAIFLDCLTPPILGVRVAERGSLTNLAQDRLPINQSDVPHDSDESMSTSQEILHRKRTDLVAHLQQHHHTKPHLSYWRCAQVAAVKGTRISGNSTPLSPTVALPTTYCHESDNFNYGEAEDEVF